jgi:DNA-binding response OmpR family regulator
MKKILFIDDESFIRETLSQVLQQAGYEVDTAEDGFEATIMLETNHYDLVVTDIVMPRKEGLELIFDLRKRKHPAKIIAVSGGGHGSAGEYLTYARGMKADMTLKKPYQSKELVEMIEKLLTTT